MNLPVGLHLRKGRYELRYKVDGKWTKRHLGTDLGEALTAYAQLRGNGRVEIVAPSASESQPEAKPAIVTFGELLDLWIEEQKRRSKRATVMSFRSQVRWLKREMEPALEEAADRVLPQMCSRFIERRRKHGVSAGTINTALRCLRAAFNFGVEQRLFPHAPFKVKMLRAAVRKDTTPFTPEEIAQVMAVACPRVRALLAIAASSGLRTGEILWLRWDDLEADGTLHVRPKVDRVRRRGEWVDIEWSPKSHQARSVVLPPETLGELQQYRAFLEEERAARKNLWPECVWMFPGKQRKAARWGDSARERLREAFQAADCYEPGRLIHAIRHSFATNCDHSGVGIETIRVLLGHSSVAVTAGYLHTDRRRLAEAAQRGTLLRPGKRS